MRLHAWSGREAKLVGKAALAWHGDLRMEVRDSIHGGRTNSIPYVGLSKIYGINDAF